MTDFLISRFLKNKEAADPSLFRKEYGQFAGTVGIFVNIFLATGKIILGFLSGAVAVIADGLNNLSDAAVSLITILGFRLAAKPADDEHPYGHGRVEYITGLVIAVIIIAVGLKTAETSIGRIISPEPLGTAIAVIAGLCLSIATKFWLGHFYQNIAGRIKSVAIQAAAKDSYADCGSTLAVLLSSLLYAGFDFNVDGWAGLIVSGFILLTGYRAARDTLYPLLGTAPDPDLLEKIDTGVKETPSILGYHDLVIHSYGQAHTFISLHAEISAALSIMDAHDIIDTLENRLRHELGADVIVHIDPIALDDSEEDDCRHLAKKLLHDFDDALTLHDFRLAHHAGEGKKISFEVMVPHGYKLSDEELIAKLKALLQKEKKDAAIQISLDHPYTCSPKI